METDLNCHSKVMRGTGKVLRVGWGSPKWPRCPKSKVAFQHCSKRHKTSHEPDRFIPNNQLNEWKQVWAVKAVAAMKRKGKMLGVGLGSWKSYRQPKSKVEFWRCSKCHKTHKPDNFILQYPTINHWHWNRLESSCSCYERDRQGALTWSRSTKCNP